MEIKKNQFWVVEMLLAPSTRRIRTVIEIYRIDETGDVAFTMCGDGDVWWRSQFHQLEFVKKVELD